MHLPVQIAKHFREVYFGGNWTGVNLKDTLKDVTWEQANKQVYGLNSIATLLYHINYYNTTVIPVLQGKPLTGKDADSFKSTPVKDQKDWEERIDKVTNDAQTLIKLIEDLPESILNQDFTDKKYGNYYRNLSGIIEHTHYHLGQIVVIKKIIKS